MSKFHFYSTPIEGMKIVENFLAEDNRGAFAKTFNTADFSEDLPFEIKETILSFSTPGVIRGLHFQTPPQAKLVSCIKGKIWDVGVDLRPNSPTYKQWFGTTLSYENHKSLFIPRGFAHGYLAIEDCIVLYQCDEIFCAEGDSGIRYNDPDIAVQWPITKPIITSEKDRNLQSFRTFKTNGGV